MEKKDLKFEIIQSMFSNYFRIKEVDPWYASEQGKYGKGRLIYFFFFA